MQKYTFSLKTFFKVILYHLCQSSTGWKLCFFAKASKNLLWLSKLPSHFSIKYSTHYYTHQFEHMYQNSEVLGPYQDKWPKQLVYSHRAKQQFLLLPAEYLDKHLIIFKICEYYKCENTIYAYADECGNVCAKGTCICNTNLTTSL